jgi:hypothetical protein
MGSRKNTGWSLGAGRRDWSCGCFLASDEASFVNGLIMTVDGGFTSAM